MMFNLAVPMDQLIWNLEVKSAALPHLRFKVEFATVIFFNNFTAG